MKNSVSFSSGTTGLMSFPLTRQKTSKFQSNTLTFQLFHQFAVFAIIFLHSFCTFTVNKKIQQFKLLRKHIHDIQLK